MGGLRGTVTQGTARAGSAAEVRLRDRHGNLHFMRCEPFHDADIIPEGAESSPSGAQTGPLAMGPAHTCHRVIISVQKGQPHGSHHTSHHHRGDRRLCAADRPDLGRLYRRATRRGPVW